MDPITASFIAGVAVEGVKASAGTAYDKKRPRRWDQESLIKRTAEAASDYVLPLLAELRDMCSEAEQDKVGKVLQTPEFAEFVHGMSVCMLVREILREDVRSGLRAQLKALLVLVGDLGEERAREISGPLVTAVSRLTSQGIDQLKKRDGVAYGIALDRAHAERAAGYLLSRDVRTQRLRKLDPSQLDHVYSFVEQYKSLIHASSSEIVPAYFETRRTVAFERVYIEPWVKVQSTRGYRIEGLRQEEFADQGLLSIDAIVESAHRAVVLGAPGAGKSTLAQRISRSLSSPASGAVVPFVVTMRRYEERKRQSGMSIAQYIVSFIAEEFQLTPGEAQIEYLLLTGRAFVIFDGLDELLETHRRREMTNAVDNFAQLYGATRILVTSREVGYWDAPLNGAAFKVAMLESFSDDDVRVYAQNWFGLDKTLTESEQRRIAKAFYEESRSVADLRTNPLMLGLLCNVYRGIGSIPTNRADLYEQCASLLFERWDASRGIKAVCSKALRGKPCSTLPYGSSRTPLRWRTGWRSERSSPGSRGTGPRRVLKASKRP